MRPQEQTRISTIALAGQPNTGKSTVFNLLTGMNQHVGNWPGKTVEKKEGEFSYNGNTYRIIDLPGTYSLSANSEEELIARDYIIRERPELVVVVVNAAVLERSLYLVSEILMLKIPMLVVLNMMDVAEDEGRVVRPEVLESTLSVKVVSMVASRKKGYDKLVEAIDSGVGKRAAWNASIPQVKVKDSTALEEIRPLISGSISEPYPEDWVSLKLLEGDREIRRLIDSRLKGSDKEKVEDLIKKNRHATQAVVDGRYEWINQVSEGVVERPPAKTVSRTARWDRWATHPVIGFFLMIGIFILTMAVTGIISVVLVGSPFMKGMFALEIWARGLMPESIPWLGGFVQGTIRGVGGVFCLLFPLTGFAAAFALLEDVGYMARAAYIMDRFLSKIGLNGKSFLPLLYGGICNILGVWATRVVDTNRARLMTIMLNPFVPCAAKTAVLVTISFMFFSPAAAVLVVVSLYSLNLIMLCGTGLLLDRSIFKRDERPGFIMELPPYHRPNLKTIWNSTWPRVTGFIKRAGTLIVFLSMAIWWISYFPTGEINTSYLGRIGRWFTPLGDLMGLDWKMITALFASMLNKEATMATMGVILATENPADLPQVLRTIMTPAAAIAFLAAQMLFMPCFWTMGVMYTESRSLKIVFGMMLYMVLISLTMGIATYQILRLFL